jgi:hypothetical protein
MTVSSGEAERISQDVLSSTDEILSVSVFDRSGNILRVESKESSKKKRFDVSRWEEGRSGGTVAVAILSLADEVKDAFDAFGEPQAIITIHENCKMMVLPMLSYDILLGLVLEHSADANDNNNIKIANEVQRLVARTLKHSKKKL